MDQNSLRLIVPLIPKILELDDKSVDLSDVRSKLEMIEKSLNNKT